MVEWWNGQTFYLDTELLPNTANLLTIYHIHSQKSFILSNTPSVLHIFPLFISFFRFSQRIFKSFHIVEIECKSTCWFHWHSKNDENELVECKLRHRRCNFLRDWSECFLLLPLYFIQTKKSFKKMKMAK